MIAFSSRRFTFFEVYLNYQGNKLVMLENKKEKDKCITVSFELVNEQHYMV